MRLTPVTDSAPISIYILCPSFEAPGQREFWLRGLPGAGELMKLDSYCFETQEHQPRQHFPAMPLFCWAAAFLEISELGVHPLTESRRAIGLGFRRPVDSGLSDAHELKICACQP